MGSILKNGEASIGIRTNLTDDLTACLIFALCLLSFITHCFADKTPIYSNIDGKVSFYAHDAFQKLSKPYFVS